MTDPADHGEALALARRSAEALYASDKAARALGIEVRSVRPGYAQLTMTVREDMVNGHDICHGGLIFTLADTAFAYACNSYNDVTVATECTIDFLRPGRLGTSLTAIAQERSRGPRTGVYDVEVQGPDGTLLALFRGKSFATGKPIATD